MSSKVAHYLQEHVTGEVVTAKSVRRYFSTDGSVFELEPEIVIYPRNTSDVRKVARFTWQLAERGKAVPITARGRGSDQSGGSLGSGIMMVFPAHMKKLLQIDPAKGTATVQPGINYASFQNALHTHGRFLPPFPSSIDYATIGGAIANNAAGEKSIKYGNTINFVRSLDVVLANGELIHTYRVGKRELSKKKGLTNFEGEIYRQIDNLLTDNAELLNAKKFDVSKNSSGYNLAQIRDKDGSIDLTPLFVGSQGTLGIITQATMATEAYNPNTTLFSAYFRDIKSAAKATSKLRELNPSAIEMVDQHLLEFIDKHNPKQLKSLFEKPFPAIVLLVEFDDVSDRKQKKLAKKARKTLQELAYEFNMTTDDHEREVLWKIRHSAAAVVSHSEGNKKALPIIEDGVVPHDKFEQYMNHIYSMFKRYKLDVAVWGHAGNANLHMQPFLDLSSIGDRQKIFKIMDDYYTEVLKMGGSTAGEHNDGRLRAPYLRAMYGDEMYELFQKVKKIFDPYNTMNPGVKIDVTREDIAPLLRREYSMEHLSDHMPRT